MVVGVEKEMEKGMLKVETREEEQDKQEELLQQQQQQQQQPPQLPGSAAPNP